MDFNVPKNFKGLTEAEIQISREKFGYNQLNKTEKTSWLKLLLDIFREPMLILIIACVIGIQVYFFGAKISSILVSLLYLFRGWQFW